MLGFFMDDFLLKVSIEFFAFAIFTKEGGGQYYLTISGNVGSSTKVIVHLV